MTDRLRLIIRLKFRRLLGDERKQAVLEGTAFRARVGWTIPSYRAKNNYAPLGVEGGVQRSLKNMQALADLLKRTSIPLSIVVYPWPEAIQREDLDSRQVKIWREFCARNCKHFINLFPALIAQKTANPNWYERLFIPGDVHFSAEGNELIFREISKYMLAEVNR